MKLRRALAVLVAALAALCSVASVSHASAPIAAATGHGYDESTIARFDVHEVGDSGVSLAQLKGVPEASASPSVGSRGPSTTASATFDATNTPDDIISAVCSFSAETRVLMADGTTKPISGIEVGDEVLAHDPASGERGPRKVTHLWVHQDTLVDLEIGGAVVATTEDHPFWNETERRWQRADGLDVGDLVLTADGGRLQVGQSTSESRSSTAYNLTVDGIHTYFVQAGDEEVLVHNTCPLSPNQMNQLIRKGNAPDGIVRVDIGKVTGEQTHAVFGRGAGAPSLNIDGTWKHGFVDLTRAQRDWLIANGWNL